MSKGNAEITKDKDSEHFDVLIVGAGISGVAAGVYLNKYCPSEKFLILEAEESFGGTWWTHRSPGIRSDSDLHTFGYSFKPWICLLYTSPSPRDRTRSRMPSSA